ncbi:hypothetical protein KUG88_27930 [Rhodococcus rhodochrous]|uniref:hypothetical protein n=1 Tax=Rhodococcus rhodochrous TaxID=1829 RepID=UPI001E55393B|nr:hypothetical protein [Rhodococcus rhodochrous]MCB8913938.1 hypothetical protein [Rhodococcus rhodochrous]
MCDLLVDTGIDTDRWTGVDIAHALNHDGTTRGWTWPTAHAMTSPLRMVAYRLSRLDWSGPSPTELKIHDRTHKDETPTDAAHRMIKTRHRALVATSIPQARPATGEHRRAMREQLATDLTAKRTAAPRCAR